MNLEIINYALEPINQPKRRDSFRSKLGCEHAFLEPLIRIYYNMIAKIVWKSITWGTMIDIWDKVILEWAFEGKYFLHDDFKHTQRLFEEDSGEGHTSLSISFSFHIVHFSIFFKTNIFRNQSKSNLLLLWIGSQAATPMNLPDLFF